jgi:hypothetical protein
LGGHSLFLQIVLNCPFSTVEILCLGAIADVIIKVALSEQNMILQQLEPHCDLHYHLFPSGLNKGMVMTGAAIPETCPRLCPHSG